MRSDDDLSFKKFGPFVWLDLGTKPFAKMLVAKAVTLRGEIVMEKFVPFF